MPTMEWVHRWSGRHHFQKHHALLAYVIRLFITLLWPARVVQLALFATRRFGTTVTKRSRKSAFHQFYEQVVFGVRHGFTPLEYYRYGLYATPNQAWLVDYIHQHEVYSLSYHLNRSQINTSTCNIIFDKQAFLGFCEQYHFSSPAIFWILEQDKNALQPPSLNNPKCSIFVKQRCGARAEGAMYWHYKGSNQYVQQPSGKTDSWPDVIKIIQQNAEQADLLVQPYLHNHADTAALSGNALSSLRILTALRPDGKVEVIAATFKMPFRPKQTHSTHSLNSPVDLDTGKLGRALRYHPVATPYDDHPMTQSKITGFLLPDWQKAKKLASDAHTVLQGYVFLGWDIALTSDAPMLLEANAGWDSATVQQPQQTPLGHTRLKAICEMWRKQKSDDKYQT